MDTIPDKDEVARSNRAGPIASESQETLQKSGSGSAFAKSGSGDNFFAKTKESIRTRTERSVGHGVGARAPWEIYGVERVLNAEGKYCDISVQVSRNAFLLSVADAEGRTVGCFEEDNGHRGRWRNGRLTSQDYVLEDSGIHPERMAGILDGLRAAVEYLDLEAQNDGVVKQRLCNRKYWRELDRAKKIAHGKVSLRPVALRPTVPASVPESLASLDALHRYDPSPSCVYFLCKDKRVVYVGQSTTLASRVNQHASDKEFDEVFYLPCDDRCLCQVEEHFIKKLDPPLNKAFTERNRNRGRHKRPAPAAKGVQS